MTKMTRIFGGGGRAPAVAKHLEKSERTMGGGGRAPVLSKHLEKNGK